MTQEEIQQKAYEVYPLDLDRHMIIEGEPYDNNKEKREAYIRGLTDSQPSLPSNLDEAAEEYGRDTFINECMENGVCDGHDLSDAFKAGAEWMAEHGETFNGYVSMKGKRSLIAIEGKSEYKFGDKVIVQIRKK